MEDLISRLDAIKKDMKNLERMTTAIRKETSIFECFDRVSKEVM